MNLKYNNLEFKINRNVKEFNMQSMNKNQMFTCLLISLILLSLFISLNSSLLFFNSNRQSSLSDKPIEDGPGNIYWVDAKIIEVLKKEVLNK